MNAAPITDAAAKTAETVAAQLQLDQFQPILDDALLWLGQNAVKIPVAILVFLVGRWIAHRATRLLRRVLTARKVDKTLAAFLENIVLYTLLTAITLAAVSQLGINVTSLLAILGAAGLAVGLALKDSLSNFAAGVMIILMRYFRQGDWIAAAGVAGTVKSITVFHTVLATADNQQVVVPNSLIMGDVITNATANDTRRIDLVVGVGYGDDLDAARDVFYSALDDPRVLADPAPVVAVSELGDSSVNFVVRPWVRTSDYWAVRWELTKKIKQALDAAGLNIPFPQRDVHLYTVAAPEPETAPAPAERPKPATP